MTDLLIRGIEPQLKRQLEERARKNRQSLSDEAKALIRRALAAPPPEPGLGTRLFSFLPDEHRGDDLVFEIRGDFPKPPDLK